MNELIREVLRSFGITRNYRGYSQMALAIELVLEDESRLLHVTEQIYQAVADRSNCDRCNVERNLRTIVLHAWQINQPLMTKMAKFALDGPPSASKFIDIVAAYIQREMRVRGVNIGKC